MSYPDGFKSKSLPLVVMSRPIKYTSSMTRILETLRLPCSLLLAAVVISAAGCDSSRTENLPSSVVVAVVNGRDINGGEFLKAYDSFKKSSRLADPKEEKLERMLRIGVLNNLIDRSLLYEEAEKIGIKVPGDMRDETAEELVKGFSPARLKNVLKNEGQTFDEWKEKLSQNMVIEKLIRTKIAPMISVPANEVKKYYRDHPEEFNVPARVHAYHIVLLTLSEADEVRNDLLEGADFSETARKYSKSPDAVDGGDLGIFSKGQMPKEFDDILFTLKRKEISKVVESPYGFHIFKVQKQLRPTKMTYADASVKIQKKMFNRQMEEKFKEWLQDVRKNAEIIIYSEQLYRL